MTQWLSVEPALRLDWSTVPATTATAGEPGRRRSAAGASGRIAQFLPPGGRMSGRPIKRTLRHRRWRAGKVEGAFFTGHLSLFDAVLGTD